VQVGYSVCRFVDLLQMRLAQSEMRGTKEAAEQNNGKSNVAMPANVELDKRIARERKRQKQKGKRGKESAGDRRRVTSTAVQKMATNDRMSEVEPRMEQKPEQRSRGEELARRGRGKRAQRSRQDSVTKHTKGGAKSKDCKSE